MIKPISGIVTLIGCQCDSDILVTYSVGCLIGGGHKQWLILCDMCPMYSHVIRGTVHTKVVKFCNLIHRQHCTVVSSSCYSNQIFPPELTLVLLV